jgi:hypothetical protein
MKINEILLESEIQNLEEGPLANKIGTAVGKGVGTLAKGVGSVAGGIAGLGAAAKKGFQAGKQTVAGAGDDPEDTAAADQTQQEPAQEKPQSFMAGLKQGLSGKKSAPATTAQDINAQGPKGTAPAKNQTGAGAQAIAKTAQAAGGNAEKAGQTLYAQVKSQVNQLDKKGKQRIMQLLQKSLAQPAPGAMGAMANQLTGQTPNTMANAPVSKTNTAPAAQTTAPAQTAAPRAKKPIKIAGTKQSPAQQPQQLAASKENTGTMVAEGFSLFRKR